MGPPQTFAGNCSGKLSPRQIFPLEIWFEVFDFVDIPDLHILSFVCLDFRIICMDKVLYKRRLSRSAARISSLIAVRPSAQDLVSQRILLTDIPFSSQLILRRAIDLSRRIKRDIIKRHLEHRPTREELVNRGILSNAGGVLADRTRLLERQRLIDDIARQIAEIAETWALEVAKRSNDEHKSVQELVRMFTHYREISPSAKSVETPTRVRVYKARKAFQATKQDYGNEGETFSIEDLEVPGGIVAMMKERVLYGP